jgi:hypothetical protein
LSGEARLVCISSALEVEPAPVSGSVAAMTQKFPQRSVVPCAPSQMRCALMSLDKQLSRCQERVVTNLAKTVKELHRDLVGIGWYRRSPGATDELQWKHQFP